MTAPVTLEALKKSATGSLIRKYEEAFGEKPSAEASRADMITRLWQHYSEHGEELPEPVTVEALLDEAYDELNAAIADDATESGDDPHYGPGDEESKVLGDTYHRILSAGEVRQIREQRATGVSYKKIAEQYGVSHTFIRNVVLRKLYKDVQ